MTVERTATYLDASVLIAAARGTDDVHKKAMEILDAPDREFTASEFLRLEVLPKPLFNKYVAEAEFYKAYFDTVEKWADDFEAVIPDSYKQAVNYGLSALDALHVASAIATGTDELITVEKRTKPLARVSTVKVISIHE